MLKQKLQPAIDELTEAGFLKPLIGRPAVQEDRRGQWTVTFVRGRCGPFSSPPPRPLPLPRPLAAFLLM